MNIQSLFIVNISAQNKLNLLKKHLIPDVNVDLEKTKQTPEFTKSMLKLNHFVKDAVTYSDHLLTFPFE